MCIRDRFDAADQDAIQPVIVQVVTVPRQLVLVDEGIELSLIHI